MSRRSALLCLTFVVGCTGKATDTASGVSRARDLSVTAGASEKVEKDAPPAGEPQTHKELAALLKWKGLKFDFGTAAALTRPDRPAYFFWEDRAILGARVVIYLCSDRDSAAATARTMGGDAFCSGRFAIGPHDRTDVAKGLAKKIRTVLEAEDRRVAPSGSAAPVVGTTSKPSEVSSARVPRMERRRRVN